MVQRGPMAWDRVGDSGCLVAELWIWEMRVGDWGWGAAGWSRGLAVG